MLKVLPTQKPRKITISAATLCEVWQMIVASGFMVEIVYYAGIKQWKCTIFWPYTDGHLTEAEKADYHWLHAEASGKTIMTAFKGALSRNIQDVPKFRAKHRRTAAPPVFQLVGKEQGK
jgi:hypothetical protein